MWMLLVFESTGASWVDHKSSGEIFSNINSYSSNSNLKVLKFTVIDNTFHKLTDL